MSDTSTDSSIPMGSEPPASRERPALGAALLFVITLLVFSSVLTHRFIVSWDDRTAILANPDYNPPEVGKLIHYWTRPPAKGLFYVPITYTIWGVLAFVARGSAPAGVPFDPRFFFAANLLAHATAVILVYLILRMLVRKDWAAWVGAALFALHPIQVEAVAGAWDLYTPLSAAFSFLAIWRYLVYSDQVSNGSTADRRRARWNYALASVAFVCGMLTKPTVATVPLIVAVIDVVLRQRAIGRTIAAMTPWLLVAAVLAWIDQRVPAAGRVYVPDPWLRPMVPLDAIAFYLGKIFVPVRLCMDYGRNPWQVAGRPIIRVTCVIAVALLAAAFLGRKKCPTLVTAFAIYVAALLPTIGIVPFTFQYFSTVADRYCYVAMLGPVLAAAFVLGRCPGKWLMAVVLAVLPVFAILSVAQLRHWRDDWAMASYTVETNPQSAAGAGTFQFLLARGDVAVLPDGRAIAKPPCTLSKKQMARTAEALQKGGFPYVAAELKEYAEEGVAR